jgi:hypothetical protein
MINVELKSLLRRLNRYCTRALEGAAGICVSRGHYEVTVEHILMVMAEDPEADLQHILRHFLTLSEGSPEIRRRPAQRKCRQTRFLAAHVGMVPGWLAAGIGGVEPE